MKNTWVRLGLSAASLALATTLVVYLPEIVGALTDKDVSWTEIGRVFGQISPQMIGLMAAVWLASLAAYTFVLTASLPGLTNLQALTLNASGSAVSNLLPFGGAAGVALTFAMAKGWGFSVRSVVVSTLVSGVWNTLFRFILPAVGIVALLLSGKVLDPAFAKAGWIGAVSLMVLVAVAGAALYWERAGQALGRGLDMLVRLPPARLRPAEHAASAALTRLRRETAEIVSRRWAALSISMIAFMVFQWLIMVCSLHAVGAYPGLAESLAVFALSRVLTTAVVTPSGAGIMEAGVAAMLAAFGVPLPAALAAALLFGFWTYTIEIPFGALALGAWALLRKRNGGLSAGGDTVEEDAHGDGVGARD
jgi:uncharacterized membrane protein YbhN (UPF0104 family)